MSWSATSTRFLNTSRDGDSTTALGSLFQCLTTLSVKKFFLISNLNLPWCNLKPFPLVLSLATSIEWGPGRQGFYCCAPDLLEQNFGSFWHAVLEFFLTNISRTPKGLKVWIHLVYLGGLSRYCATQNLSDNIRPMLYNYEIVLNHENCCIIKTSLSKCVHLCWKDLCCTSHRPEMKVIFIS